MSRGLGATLLGVALVIVIVIAAAIALGVGSAEVSLNCSPLAVSRPVCRQPSAV